jgi:NAD(P)-dependent dehydrogenase (short-subunit alcohol dehydrogenase family)
MDTFSLKGKVALVTGGAGSFGKQILEAVAQAGATTYVASRNIEALKKEADKLNKQGYDVRPLQYDQGDEESILQLKESILKDSGRIDILINNAVARLSSEWDVSSDTLQESFKINITGVFLMCRAFSGAMIAQKSGSIINIGSIHGMMGCDSSLYKDTDMRYGNPAYFCEKGSMINFTRFLGSMLGEYNIRCNCISPGGLETPKTNEVFKKRYNQKTFLGRMANNEDLKGIVVFLASDASKYITGTNIPVDGGMTAL